LNRARPMRQLIGATEDFCARRRPSFGNAARGCSQTAFSEGSRRLKNRDHI